MRFVPFLVAAAALAGCTTPYQEMGVLGGVRAARITEDTAQITAVGNGYTDVATIQRYALRRAAEETVNDGFDLFRIGDAADTTRQGSESFGSAYGTRYGAFASGWSMPVIKPGQVLMIKMLHGPAPSPVPDGEFDAHEVLKYLAQGDASADHRHCAPDAAGKVVCQ